MFPFKMAKVICTFKNLNKSKEHKMKIKVSLPDPSLLIHSLSKLTVSWHLGYAFRLFSYT